MMKPFSNNMSNTTISIPSSTGSWRVPVIGPICRSTMQFELVAFRRIGLANSANDDGHLVVRLTAQRLPTTTINAADYAVDSNPHDALSPAQTAHAQDNSIAIHPRRGRLGVSVRHVGSARLFVALIVSCSWLPASSLADEFERTHRREIQEMVAANVRIETGFGVIDAEYRRKVRSDPNPKAPSLLAEGRLIQDCSDFIYATFYAKFRKLIDNIDTSSFDSPEELRKDRSDMSILRDPRKIAYETKYRISGFKYLKEFYPPIEEFVVRYSVRPDLEAKCAHYLESLFGDP